MFQPNARRVQTRFMDDAVRMTTLLEGCYFQHAEALFLSMAEYVANHERKLEKEHLALFTDISRALSIREPPYFERLLFDLNLLLAREPRPVA